MRCGGDEQALIQSLALTAAAVVTLGVLLTQAEPASLSVGKIQWSHELRVGRDSGCPAGFRTGRALHKALPIVGI